MLDLEFTCGGQPVDVSACEITAEITPSEKLQEEAETLEVSDEIADEAEIGIQLMALTANDAGETEEADSVTVEKGAEDVPKMAVALNAAEPKLQIVTRSSLNPKFTVQYYANLEVTDRDSGGYLQIIDTSNGGKQPGEASFLSTEPIRRLRVCTSLKPAMESARFLRTMSSPSSTPRTSTATSRRRAFRT